MCRGEILKLHMKTDDDWTGKLRRLAEQKGINIGIDGPFSAPAQCFYEYNRTLIIGAIVGVTPFSAIISDLEQNIALEEDG